MTPARLEALIRMLLDSGDMTPMAARLLRGANDEDRASEPAEPEPQR